MCKLHGRLAAASKPQGQKEAPMPCQTCGGRAVSFAFGMLSADAGSTEARIRRGASLVLEFDPIAAPVAQLLLHLKELHRQAPRHRLQRHMVKHPISAKVNTHSC
eukprot:6212205-Pleurochrysis_carterae.AAC.2